MWTQVDMRGYVITLHVHQGRPMRSGDHSPSGLDSAPPLLYAERNATVGSSLAARRAG